MHAEPDQHDSPAAVEVEEEVWHRLHATSLFFGIGLQMRRLLVPALFVLVAILLGTGRGSRWELLLLILFVPAVIFEVFRYFTTRYRVTSEDLVIRRGLFFRSERIVPFRRVQNIDLVQGPLHRLLGVAGVKIETAGGAEAEAELNVMAFDAIEALRGSVFARREPGRDEGLSRAEATLAEERPGDDVAAGEPALPILRLSTVEVVKLGIISWRGLVLVAVALGLAWEMGLIEHLNIAEFLDRFTAGEVERIAGWWWAVLGAAVILFLMLLSIIWAILRFHDFTLERRENHVRLRTGLLTKISATVPRPRIQFVSVRETLLHRVFGRVSIRVETAGGKRDDGDHDSMSERWIVPILPKRDLPRVLEELQPGLSFELDHWQTPAPRATRRMMIKATIAGVIVGSLGLLVWRPWGAVAIALMVAWFCWMAWRERTYMACALSDFGMHFRSGSLTRVQSAARYEKMQVVHLRRSPFDRRHGHATLSVDTAGAGPAGHRIAMPYLDADFADRSAARLFEEIQTTRYQWE